MNLGWCCCWLFFCLVALHAETGSGLKRVGGGGQRGPGRKKWEKIGERVRDKRKKQKRKRKRRKN